MNNSKETILSIIKNSSLSSEQKAVWDGFLENLEDELVLNLLDAIKEDESALHLLTENIEEKFVALISKDQDEWEKITQKEKEILADISE